ncbi:MAG: thiamine pyrophosphate-dependent enzyme [Verrucomicrobiota bacterium]|jgi:thiamine pyrophosphate-dependent acetolactate synthase large subunit-like protein|nr:thiamine pyrophosphate-dependent enzyme [Verrucomicrobiota bacterium]
MSDQAMTLPDALDVIHRQRRDAVVITTMGSARDWQQLEPHPKDLVYMPSSMGQGPPLGLGIALAQPDQRVIVVNGDGCLLMNLGCLVTITAQAPKNFTLILIDNGVYEVTGNQATNANASRRAGGFPIDFQAMARAAGFEAVYEFDDAESWRYEHEVMHDDGPICIVLKTTAKTENAGALSPGPGPERASAFRKTLSNEAVD